MENDYNAVKQNLIDAGCDEQLIRQFMSLLSEQKTTEMLSLLAGHRKDILNGVHTEERKIYCLYYLINKLNK